MLIKLELPSVLKRETPERKEILIPSDISVYTKAQKQEWAETEAEIWYHELVNLIEESLPRIADTRTPLMKSFIPEDKNVSERNQHRKDAFYCAAWGKVLAKTYLLAAIEPKETISYKEDRALWPIRHRAGGGRIRG